MKDVNGRLLRGSEVRKRWAEYFEESEFMMTNHPCSPTDFLAFLCEEYTTRFSLS